MTPIETAADILRVGSPDEYRAKFLQSRLVQRGLLNPLAPLLSLRRLQSMAAGRSGIERPVQGSLEAHLNAGRWVTTCVCGGGIALHPDWSFAGCFDCGRTWTSIVFPESSQLEEIDALLAERPSRPGHVIPHPFYSWVPGETAVDLQRQNVRLAAARHFGRPSLARPRRRG